MSLVATTTTKWALESVEKIAFCSSNEGDQVCKLSPYSLVIPDPEGVQILENMNDIPQLNLFKRTRIIHAFERISCLMGSFRSHFLVNRVCYVFMKKVNLPLNHLITTENESKERRWTIDSLIIKTITKRNGTFVYDEGSIQEAIRFVRNKIAHS